MNELLYCIQKWQNVNTSPMMKDYARTDNDEDSASSFYLDAHRHHRFVGDTQWYLIWRYVIREVMN
jgi:hypothetical protein